MLTESEREERSPQPYERRGGDLTDTVQQEGISPEDRVFIIYSFPQLVVT